ncbi:hypothetical protein A7982_13886 [Minicystis rosea]|nr:hypothetical protein A7982_13886 [Minicystis rosea]
MISDEKHLDPTWPYEEVESHETIASEPTWTCAAGFCACHGGVDIDAPPQKFSILLCDEHARHMAGARVRVLADGILVNEDQPHADGKGRIEVEWRRLPEIVLIEWAPESPPLEPRYPFRKRHYVDLADIDREEAARRRLHNLGYATRPALEDNLRDFQRAYGRKETGKLEHEESRLIRFNDGKELPPLRTTHHGGITRAAFVAPNDEVIELQSGGPPRPGGSGSGGIAGGAAAPPPATPQQNITLSVFVKFEVWNLTTKTFVPLSGMTVDMLDLGTFTDTTLDTRVTDAGGVAHFEVTDQTRATGKAVDLTFLAKPAKRQVGGVTLPDKWSTNGWKATNGTEGLQRDFRGDALGTQANPVVFRVGIDFHLRITYEFTPHGAAASQTANAVEGVGVTLSYASMLPKQFFTDQVGEVHGVHFDSPPGDRLEFGVSPFVRNGSINLPHAAFEHEGMSPFWQASRGDADAPLIENNHDTSIGTQTAPMVFKGVDHRAACMYIFKVLTEWSRFLFTITSGAWKGIKNLVIFPHTLGGPRTRSPSAT